MNTTSKSQNLGEITLLREAEYDGLVLLALATPAHGCDV